MGKTSFTTTDIIRDLDIPRERLRDWLSREFIKPSIPSPGQGRAAEFTLWDVYMIQLFQNLIDGGFDRNNAAKFVKKFKENKENLKINCIVFRREDKKISAMIVIKVDEWRLDLKSGKVEKEPKLRDDSELLWDDVFIVNFKKIRDAVDSRMSD